MEDGGARKISHKGVPKSTNLTDESYYKCLYENDPGSVSYSNITISKKNNEATTRTTKKIALNSTYLKLHVEPNNISIRPHMNKNGYV